MLSGHINEYLRCHSVYMVAMLPTRASQHLMHYGYQSFLINGVLAIWDPGR